MFLGWGCAGDSLQTIEAGKNTSLPSDESDVSDERKSYNAVTVHICGEVYFPGVYTVYEGSRIYEVIIQAGGFTKDADTEAVNQAKEVLDGEQIYIPSVQEKENEANAKGLININKASEAVLCTIPGIGLQRAKQIIEYREENGKFKNRKELLKKVAEVGGIPTDSITAKTDVLVSRLLILIAGLAVFPIVYIAKLYELV